MGHYKSNVRDLEFNMFEVLGINEALDAGEFGDSRHRHGEGHPRRGPDPDRGPVAESFASPTATPVSTRDPLVSIPEDSKQSFAAWYDAGYTSWACPERRRHADRGAS